MVRLETLQVLGSLILFGSLLLGTAAYVAAYARVLRVHSHRLPERFSPRDRSFFNAALQAEVQSLLRNSNEPLGDARVNALVSAVSIAAAVFQVSFLGVAGLTLYLSVMR